MATHVPTHDEEDRQILAGGGGFIFCPGCNTPSPGWLFQSKCHHCGYSFEELRRQQDEEARGGR